MPRRRLRMASCSMLVLATAGCEDESWQRSFPIDHPVGIRDGQDIGPGYGEGELAARWRSLSEGALLEPRGDRLYAASPQFGLAVFDIADPSSLPVLGRAELPGLPFSLEVEDERVLALVSHTAPYAWDEDEQAHARQVESRLLALDASDPTRIELVGSRDLPGGVLASVRVGDRRYVATSHRDESDRTTILVFDLTQPLREPTRLQIPGVVTEPWQMQARGELLHVLARTGTGARLHVYSTAPMALGLELGALDVAVRDPEAVRELTLDGTHGFVTVRDEGVVIVDLTDPAAPERRATLALPEILHVRARGDRLLVLAVDPDSHHSLALSLYSFGSTEPPTLLSRRTFAGIWEEHGVGSRSAGAFSFHWLERGWVIVPHLRKPPATGCREGPRRRSTLYRVDGGDLLEVGELEVTDPPQRFLETADEVLLGVGLRSITAYDLTSSSAPTLLGQHTLLPDRTGSRTATEGFWVARVSRGEADPGTHLEVAPLGTLHDPPVGRLALPPEAPPFEPADCSFDYDVRHVHLRDQIAYLVRESQDELALDLFDLGTPSAPAFLRTVPLPPLHHDADALPVELGTGLALYRRAFDAEAASFTYVDLASPASPRISSTFDLPDAHAGFGGVQRLGDTLVAHGITPDGADSSKVHLWMHRFDLLDGEPRVREPVQVPGLVVAYDAPTGRAVALRGETLEVDCETRDEHQIMLSGGTEGWCTVHDQWLEQIVIGDAEVRLLGPLDLGDPLARIGGVLSGPERLFVILDRRLPDSAPRRHEVLVWADWKDRQPEPTGRVAFESPIQWPRPILLDEHRILVRDFAALVEIDAREPERPAFVAHSTDGWNCWAVEVAGETALCSVDGIGELAVSLE